MEITIVGRGLAPAGICNDLSQQRGAAMGVYFLLLAQKKGNKEDAHKGILPLGILCG